MKVRLSWPKTKDKRRFVIGPVPVPGARGKITGKPHFLNVTSKQVEQYLALTEDGYAAIGACALP